jgi:hypothetical protein
VAAVNSTVLNEALARRRPVLVMGEWLLTGQGAAYDALSDGDGAVRRWLKADDFAQMHARWLDALGYLLSQSLYAYSATGSRVGMLSADDLAARIAQAASPTGWCAPDALISTFVRVSGGSISSWNAGDAHWSDRRDSLNRRIEQWHHGQSIRHALLPAYQASRDGRRLTIWGSDARARRVCSLIEGAGARVTVLLAPLEALTSPISRDDFIVVATADVQPLLHRLCGAGLQPMCDYSVVAPHLLA